MHPLGERDQVVIGGGQVLAATGIGALLSLGHLQENVAIRGGDVANQVTERELAVPEAPIHLVGRNRANDVHRALVDLLVVALKFSEVADFHQCLTSLRSNSAISVPVIVATSRSSPPLSMANARASQTVSVFPALTTLARNANRSPLAGATRFVLNSTVRTAASAGIRENAAYPQALSSAVVMIPACMKPCCWLYAGEKGIVNSTSPGSRWAISTPKVCITCWRAKLARTRSAKLGSGGENFTISSLSYLPLTRGSRTRPLSVLYHNSRAASFALWEGLGKKR